MDDDAVATRDRCAAGVRAARALGDSYNYRGAADAARDVLRADPDHVEAHYLLGLYLLNLSEHTQAIAECGAAVALAPENAVAHRLLGIALGAAAATKRKGLGHLDEALRLDPHEAYNHYCRARALAGLARPGEALAAYESACALAPTEATILAGTAEFLFATNRRRRASEFAGRAFAVAPDDLAALTVEARSRLLRGRFADARALARAAVAILPTHRAALTLLVEADMCRHPVHAVWSRLKNWASAARWRRALLLLAAIHIVPIVVGLAVAAFPDDPWVAITTFGACLVLPAWPGIVFRRRLAAATRPVRLGKRF